jgi:hypothetical protein
MSSNRSIKRKMDKLKNKLDRIAAVELKATITKPAEVNNFLRACSVTGKSTNTPIPLVKVQNVPVSVNNSEVCITSVSKPVNDLPTMTKIELPDVTPVVNGKVAGPELINPVHESMDSFVPVIDTAKGKKKGKRPADNGL